MIFLLPVLISACSKPEAGGPAEGGAPTFAVDPDRPREMPNLLSRSDLEIVGEFGRGGRQLGQRFTPL